MVSENSEYPQKDKTLSSNLKLLKSNNPLLYEKVLKTDSHGFDEKKFDGETILSLTFSSKKSASLVFQSKKMDSKVLKLTSYKNLKDYDVIVIEGFGLGEHILEIIEATSDSTFILVIEQDIQFFREIIHYVDLKPFFIKRFSLSVNEPPFQATRKRLEDYFGVYTIKDIKVFRDPVSIELDPEYYDEIDSQLAGLSEVAKLNQATLKKFSGIWQRHILSNLKSVVIMPGINELFNEFQGIPTIIVSAGPSLDKNIEWLAGAKGKAIIMAVDTAFKPLLRHNILPDFVVSLDAQEENYKHLEGVKEKEVCLIANPVVHPAVIKEFSGTIFMMNFGDPLMLWIENQIGKKGETLSGGSVATSVFDLAYKLGSSPIILVGQDLSYTDNRAYAEWCYFDRVWLDEISKFRTLKDIQNSKSAGDGNFYEKGIFREEIYTSSKMFNWKQWFEVMIQQNEIHCVNSTEDGLEIQGVEFLPLKEAISLYCIKKINVKKVILDVKSKYQITDITTFIKHLKELKDKVSRMGYIGKEGNKVSSLLLKISENLDQQQLNFDIHLQKMGIFAEQILNEQEFIEINKWCVETLLDKMKIESPVQDKNRNDTDLIRHSIRSYHILFEGIDEMCSHYENKLDQAIGELNELQ